MKNQHRQALALFLVGLLLTIGSGCASTSVGTTAQRVDAPRTQMTVSQARKSLVESLNHQIGDRKVRKVKFSRDRVDFTIHEKEGSSRGVVIFAEMKNLVVQSHRWTVDEWCGVQSNGKDLYFETFHSALFENINAAMTFVDAVLVLKEAQSAPGRDEADIEEAKFAAFTASAKSWLATTPKPGMSDDVRGYKVLAEDAFKRKDFAAALDAYGKALELYPTWPEGQYNAALLAAEAEEYELAAQHMRRYLVLAANAKDASAAKDKLLLWQIKAKQ